MTIKRQLKQEKNFFITLLGYMNKQKKFKGRTKYE